MEFNEKLQKLRKQRVLTQEELADFLYVSRTAVSKWESGRGYPSIDSLKAIANFFSVSIDDLLSGNELLTIAQEDNTRTEHRYRDQVFGLLDCSAATFFFLPFFGQKAGDAVSAVSLLSLTETAPWLKGAYILIVTAISLWGIVTLAMQNCRTLLWMQSKSRISLALNAAGVFLFIISLQPYAAVFLLVFLLIKALMLIKFQ